MHGRGFVRCFPAKFVWLLRSPVAGAFRHVKVAIATPSRLAAQVALGKPSLPPRRATFLHSRLGAPLQREALWAFDQADFCHAALQRTATAGHSVLLHCLAEFDEVPRFGYLYRTDSDQKLLFGVCLCHARHELCAGDAIGCLGGPFATDPRQHLSAGGTVFGGPART
jgi:hypothetical protein